MPWEEVRHGGVIPVTERELDNILATWAKEAPKLLSIATPKNVTARAGSEASSLKLPDTVSATLSDGNVIDVPVTWDTKGISLEKEGRVTITGKLASATGTIGEKEFTFTDEEKLTVQAELLIKKASSGIIYVISGITAVVIIIIALMTILLIKKRNMRDTKV